MELNPESIENQQSFSAFYFVSTAELATSPEPEPTAIFQTASVLDFAIPESLIGGRFFSTDCSSSRSRSSTSIKSTSSSPKSSPSVSPRSLPSSNQSSSSRILSLRGFSLIGEA